MSVCKQYVFEGYSGQPLENASKAGHFWESVVNEMVTHFGVLIINIFLILTHFSIFEHSNFINPYSKYVYELYQILQ